MKRQEEMIAQMDEIIFEHRNKAYGAYLLRKLYRKHLSRALLIAVGILVAGLAYPLAAGYYAGKHAKFAGNEGITEFMSLPDAHDEVVPPPPPPPPAKDMEAKVKFVAPEVTTDEVGEDDGIPNQDDLNKYSENIPVDVAAETPAEKQPVVIDVPEAQKEVFTIVEEMPSFQGGEGERQKFLASNIAYPLQATEIGIQGTVYVKFVVDSKGNITDAVVLRGIGGGCDEEALRVVNMMPQWHPGKQNGKAVRVLYNMAIVFKLKG
jgi:protein TonB